MADKTDKPKEQEQAKAAQKAPEQTVVQPLPGVAGRGTAVPETPVPPAPAAGGVGPAYPLPEGGNQDAADKASGKKE